MIDSIQEKWPIDGKDHKDISYDSLYHNENIKRFFTTDRSILVAAKGMGKTLLLRSKKYQLERIGGHLLIPRNSERDIVRLSGSFSKKGLDDSILWEELWFVCILLSILSHRFSQITDSVAKEPLWVFLDGLELSEKLKDLITEAIFNRAELVPSDFLVMFLNEGLRTVRRLSKTAFNIDALGRSYIQSSTAVFIDALDQALVDTFPNDLDVWRDAQKGLISAAWKINSANAHVKVYVSIRQEAWAAFDSENREAIKGSAIILKHDKRSLRKMFEHAVKKYTHYENLKEFAGLNFVTNLYCDESEDLFDYIYRHSSGSPRSLMWIGEKLDSADLNSLPIEEREVEFRRIINYAGAEQVYEDYLLSQKKIFLTALKNREDIDLLLSLIPAQVLPGSALITIRNTFAELTGQEVKECRPFCELRNIGLLGCLEVDLVTNELRQNFKAPYEFEWSDPELIRSEKTYLVHPSLHQAISKERKAGRYHLNSFNIVGHDRPWRQNDLGLMFPTIFISHSSEDKDQVEMIIRDLSKRLDLLYPCKFWYDKKSIKCGEDIHAQVEIGVGSSDCVLVLITEKSINSGWVEREWREKHKQEIEEGRIRVVCCTLGDIEPAGLPGSLSNKKALILKEDDTYEDDISSLAEHMSEHLVKSKNLI